MLPSTKSVIPQFSAASTTDGGRVTLDLKLWDKVGSTPFGRYADLPIEKPVKNPSRVIFDHYTLDKDPVTAAKEFYSNRRTFKNIAQSPAVLLNAK